MPDNNESQQLIKTVPLYSDECLALLRQALTREQELAKKDGATSASLRQNSEIVSSDSEAEDQRQDEESSSGSSSEEEEAQKATASSPASNDNSTKASQQATNINKPSKQHNKAPKKHTQSEKERQHALKKYVEQLICDTLPIQDTEAIHVPASLLSKNPLGSGSIADRNYVATSPCQEYVALSEALSSQQYVLVLLLRSGRFAAGIFQGAKCVVHRACQRYTVRKGQGKAQSAQDSGGRKPKSMGAQLRRAGEENLQQDIKETMEQWKPYLVGNASKQKTTLILVSCPKSMKKYLFDAIDLSIVTKDDPRLRRLPLDMGRPTYESVCMAHEVMMTVQLRHWSETPTLTDASVGRVVNDTDSNTTTTKQTQSNKRMETLLCKAKPEILFPLTPLHEACQTGNVERISELLASGQQSFSIPPVTSEEGDMPQEEATLTVAQMINRRVGPDFWTCLHYAAAVNTKQEQQSTADNGEATTPATTVDPETAAACITQLLVDGKADPTIVDARNRPPYFVATHDKIRDAFRMARAVLGEVHCAWDQDAKVGPALTEDDIQSKKEREAEKKRKKKARQKQKKAQEKAQTEQDQRQREEAEEERKQEEDAKRVRDGLKPKTASVAGGTSCDFCQKVVRGKKRKDMYSRLDYVYCTADCVQKHKRELVAAAALARFGG